MQNISCVLCSSKYSHTRTQVKTAIQDQTHNCNKCVYTFIFRQFSTVPSSLSLPTIISFSASQGIQKRYTKKKIKTKKKKK